MFGHRFQTLTADALSSLRGVAAMVRWSTQRDDLAVALASFRAHSARACAGEANAYELVLANASGTDIVARVLIDLYVRDEPTHPHGHYAFFEKVLLVRQKRAQSVAITYDWQSGAQFSVEGVVLPADALWRGACDRAGLYVVHAVLLNPGASAAQPLSLVQELI